MHRYRRHDNWQSALCFSIGGAGIGAMLAGLGTAIVHRERMIDTVVPAAYLGLMIGLAAWSRKVLPEQLARRRAERRVARRRHRCRTTRIHVPAPFTTRLAGYLHCDEQQLMQPKPRPQSRMPFWSLVDLRTRHPPKPVEWIRRLLNRIHAAVRGGR